MVGISQNVINTQTNKPSVHRLSIWLPYIPSLAEKIQQNSPYSINDIVQLMKEVVKVFIGLHKSFLAHGNVKPQNILIKEEEDKEIQNNQANAKVQISKSYKVFLTDFSQSKQNMFIKNPYTPPEIAEYIDSYKEFPRNLNSQTTSLIDIYGLGVIMIMLGVGYTDLNNEFTNPEKLLAELEYKCTINEIPRKYFTICRDMINKKASQRITLEYCFSELQKIEEILNQEPVEVKEEIPLSKKQIEMERLNQTIKQIQQKYLVICNKVSEHKAYKFEWENWEDIEKNPYWWKENGKTFHGQLLKFKKGSGWRCYQCWDFYKEAKQQIDSMNTQMQEIVS